MKTTLLASVVVSALVTLVIAGVSLFAMRSYVRGECERAIQEREERFVNTYRQRVVKMRADFGLPAKPVETIEDVLEPVLLLSE